MYVYIYLYDYVYWLISMQCWLYSYLSVNSNILV